MKVTFTLEGGEKLRADFDALGRRIERQTQRAVLVAALAVQNDAKRAVPVDTGRLKNSIDHKISEDGFSAEVGTNVEYAAAVEFGRGGRGGSPYLFPALEANRPAFEARLHELLRGGA